MKKEVDEKKRKRTPTDEKLHPEAKSAVKTLKKKKQTRVSDNTSFNTNTPPENHPAMAEMLLDVDATASVSNTIIDELDNNESEMITEVASVTSDSGSDTDSWDDGDSDVPDMPPEKDLLGAIWYPGTRSCSECESLTGLACKSEC